MLSSNDHVSFWYMFDMLQCCAIIFLLSFVNMWHTYLTTKTMNRYYFDCGETFEWMRGKKTVFYGEKDPSHFSPIASKAGDSTQRLLINLKFVKHTFYDGSTKKTSEHTSDWKCEVLTSACLSQHHYNKEVIFIIHPVSVSYFECSCHGRTEFPLICSYLQHWIINCHIYLDKVTDNDFLVSFLCLT